MPRARNIKHSFFVDAKVSELGPWARLLFIGLWTLADCDGLVEDHPKQIKFQLFPGDDVEVDSLLDELAGLGFIRRFAAQDENVLHIVNFRRHQNPHPKEASSGLPLPPEIPAPEPSREKTRQATAENDEPRKITGILNPSFLNPESRETRGAHAPAPSHEPAPKRRPSQTKASRSFQPDADTLAWARDRGWTGERFELEFEKFLDHHIAKGNRYANWDQALRNWLKRAEEYAAQKVVPIRAGPANGRPSYEDFTAVLDDIIAGGNA